MSTSLLAAIGIGAPAIGLLLGRWLSAGDVGREMRRHQRALAVLAELTRDGASRP